MKSFKQVINEKTYNINNAVELIFDRYLKQYFDRLEKDSDYEFEDFPRSGIVVNLQKIYNPLIDSALETTPIVFEFEKKDDARENGYYDRIEKRIVVFVSPKRLIQKKQMNDLRAERGMKIEDLSQSIKGTIYHELTHWLDDAFYHHDIYATRSGDRLYYYETNAYINALISMKHSLGDKEWNEMTLDDLILYDKSIKNAVSTNIKDDEMATKKWILDFAKRLHREGLLGNNMHKLDWQNIKDHLLY